MGWFSFAGCKNDYFSFTVSFATLWQCCEELRDSVPVTAALVLPGTGWGRCARFLQADFPIPERDTSRLWSKTQGQCVKYCTLHVCRQAQKMVGFVFMGKLLSNCLFLPSIIYFFSVEGLSTCTTLFLVYYILIYLRSKMTPFQKELRSLVGGDAPACLSPSPAQLWTCSPWMSPSPWNSNRQLNVPLRSRFHIARAPNPALRSYMTTARDAGLVVFV